MRTIKHNWDPIEASAGPPQGFSSLTLFRSLLDVPCDTKEHLIFIHETSRLQKLGKPQPAPSPTGKSNNMSGIAPLPPDMASVSTPHKKLSLTPLTIPDLRTRSTAGSSASSMKTGGQSSSRGSRGSTSTTSRRSRPSPTKAIKHAGTWLKKLITGDYGFDDEKHYKSREEREQEERAERQEKVSLWKAFSFGYEENVT
jgi:hypothetical protein